MSAFCPILVPRIKQMDYMVVCYYPERNQVMLLECEESEKWVCSSDGSNNRNRTQPHAFSTSATAMRYVSMTTATAVIFFQQPRIF